MVLHRYSLLQGWHEAVRPLRRPWQKWRLRQQPPLSLMALARRPGTRVQLIIAHPGDELFCAGLLLALKEAGAELAITCLTRGEGGESGGHPREKLGSIREKELRAASDVLGVGRVHFLGYIDPLPQKNWHPVPEFLSPKLIADLSAQIRTFVPDIIITHGTNGEGWGPAHVLLNVHLHKTFAQMRKLQQNTAIRVLTFNPASQNYPFPHLLNPDDAVRLELDVTRFQAKRLAALACHASQEGAFAAMTGSAMAADFVTRIQVESFGGW